MNNEQLNKAIRNTEDSEEFIVKELEGTSKCIPYLGWYWRDVDFDHDISLGILPKISDPPEKTDGWIGFMENNKWGYDEFTVKGEQQKELRQMVEKAVTNPTNEKLQDLFDYIQSLRPSKVEV